MMQIMKLFSKYSTILYYTVDKERMQLFVFILQFFKVINDPYFFSFFLIYIYSIKAVERVEHVPIGMISNYSTQQEKFYPLLEKYGTTITM